MSRILFIPVSGGEGSGEVERCRLLAHAVRERAPQADVHFLLAARAPAIPEPTTRIGDSPTRAVPEVVAAIAALQPTVVVFDGNTRVAALDAARRAGARSVLISSRPSARDRGLRWRRMARLDAHWLVGADLLAPAGWRERLAHWRFPRVDIRRYATLFAPPVDTEAVLQRLGLRSPYVVVCPGGGGHALAGVPAAEVFGTAAAALARGGLQTLAVATQAAAPAIDIARLPNADLMAVLSRADAALLGGGSLLVQALALRVPVLALPLQSEQAARVRWLQDAGAIDVASGTEASALTEQLRDLLQAPDRMAQLRARSDALGLRNGLEDAAAALAALL